MTEDWTSLKLIQWTKGYFEKGGVPNPRLDAELLLAHVLKCQRIDLYVNHERILKEKELSQFRELIQRRCRREPLQYIIGETEFYGLKFKVGPAVLIPRPETELLVEKALSDWSDKSDGSDQILEIGTGSGCIAIALAKHLPNAQIVATDISKETLEIAHQNAKFHGVEDRIEFIAADIAPWRRFLAEERQFDLIVSNPPYIPTTEFPNLQPEVRDFEPRLALDGGNDGLDFYKTLLQDAVQFLKSGGRIILEMGEGQSKDLTQIMESCGLKGISTLKDYSEKDRVIQGEKNG